MDNNRKKKKSFKEKIRESVLVKGEFYVKISLTLLFVVLYLLVFFFNDGVVYFEKYGYAYTLKNNPFQVHFIDVENGDAILIKLPNNKTMMIDTGEGKYYDKVASYLRQYRYYEKTKCIDYLVLTHSDSDHIGNASKIIENFAVKTLFRPKIYSNYEVENVIAIENYKTTDSDIYNQVMVSAYKNNCEIIYNEAGIRFVEGDVKIEFLSPSEREYSENNNYSAVIMMTYKNKKLLFSGDAETKIEKTLIDEYGDYLKADVLKVGHHGSNTSTSQEFLDIVRPNYAIISSSGNSSILPSSEIVDRLLNNNIEILSTANLDSFAITYNDDEIIISKANKENKCLELILVAILLIVFIMWKIPFEDLKIYPFKP